MTWEEFYQQLSQEQLDTLSKIKQMRTPNQVKEIKKMDEDWLYAAYLNLDFTPNSLSIWEKLENDDIKKHNLRTNEIDISLVNYLTGPHLSILRNFSSKLTNYQYLVALFSENFFTPWVNLTLLKNTNDYDLINQNAEKLIIELNQELKTKREKLGYYTVYEQVMDFYEWFITELEILKRKKDVSNWICYPFIRSIYLLEMFGELISNKEYAIEQIILGGLSSTKHILPLLKSHYDRSILKNPKANKDELLMDIYYQIIEIRDDNSKFMQTRNKNQFHLFVEFLTEFNFMNSKWLDFCNNHDLR